MRGDYLSGFLTCVRNDPFTAFRAGLGN